MYRLAANWQFQLVNQLLRGKFFIRPDFALGMGGQVASILAGDRQGNMPVRRHLEVLTIDESGNRRTLSYLDDFGDEEDSASTGSIYDDVPAGSVAIIPVKGTMMKYGSWCDYGTTELASMLTEAANHKNISSIVLDIDSGGGAVDAVAPMVQAIRSAKKSKPVVASIDLACSAAYWIASECERLVADNGISAEVGSIGVMMSFMDVREHYEKNGYKMHTIYSSLSPDKNLSFQKAIDGDYEMIIAEDLDPLAIGFQNAVKANRGQKLKLSTPGILTGKTYFSEAALSAGLIDAIGNRDTAAQVAIGFAHARKLL